MQETSSCNRSEHDDLFGTKNMNGFGMLQYLMQCKIWERFNTGLTETSLQAIIP